MFLNKFVLKRALNRLNHFNRFNLIQQSKSISSFSNTFSLAGNRDLPVNTIVKFVPQQEAWIVERMGKSVFYNALDLMVVLDGVLDLMGFLL